jgi:hypothetical protein
MNVNRKGSTAPRWLVATIGAVALASAFLAGRLGASGIPATGTLTYSGTLEDAAGAPLTGDRNIQVTFWGSATGGTTPLCLATAQTITLAGGRFSVVLPDTCAAAVQSNKDVWVEALVDGNSLGLNKLGAVPYAIEAGHSTTADTATNAMQATSAAQASTLAAGPVAGNLTIIKVAGNAITAPCVVTGGAIVDCTCPDGTFVVSGGANVGSGTGRTVRESQAVNATTWRITCASGTTDVLCSAYSLICSRIGP